MPARRLPLRAASVATLLAAMLPEPAASQPSQPAPIYLPPVAFDPNLAGPVSPWPRPIPIRLKPTGRDDLFVMTLGEVATPLADGVFDPKADTVTLKSGRAIANYYRDQLKVRYYAPIDKSVFPVPPSGWCSWYYYYHELNAAEVLANAHWAADHLKPYGFRYIQIDDAWQGTGHGINDNRDWTWINERFVDPGMDGIAAAIRKLGLEAGIWLAPQGQSNEQLARQSGAFLWKPDGTSASDTWEGKFLLDPSIPAGHAYLKDLFERLRGWGYTYFKIDGQPVVIDEYGKKSEFMKGTVPAAQPGVEPAEELYRGTLRTIRSAIGRHCYLLGCWGIPLAAAGLVNGSRTGGDIVPGWDGFLVANDAVQRWNFLHNVVWYCDPDVCMVRPPLDENVARCWATIQGLSGQALLTSDRLMDLPASRVELLKRIYPAVDVRPLDLYQPDNTRKTIWALLVSHALPPTLDGPMTQRRYVVVALFNFDERQAATRHVRWSDLGLDASTRQHVYDYWQKAYLGAWRDGVFIEVPPADVRVLTLAAASDEPELIGTSRHITQGWVDLKALSRPYAVRGGLTRISGMSRVIDRDPYTLTFGVPVTGRSFRLRGVEALNTAGERFPADIVSGLGFAAVTITPRQTQEVSWHCDFEEDPAPYLYPVAAPASIRIEPKDLTGAAVTWDAQYYSKAGYQVELDGQPLGVAFHNRAELRDLRPGRSYRIGVRTVWYDGRTSEKVAEVEHMVTLPRRLHLSDLAPEAASQSWGNLGRDRSVEGRPLTVGGQKFDKGLGTHADSRLAFRLYGGFKRLTARVGLDDETRPPPPQSQASQPATAKTVLFEVFSDGRKLWESGSVRHGEPARPLDVDISGVELLELKVRALDGDINYDHADWLDALVLVE